MNSIISVWILEAGLLFLLYSVVILSLTNTFHCKHMLLLLFFKKLMKLFSPPVFLQNWAAQKMFIQVKYTEYIQHLYDFPPMAHL